MTNLTPEIIESATLNTPYYIDKSFSTDEGVNVAAICDVNGFHVFDCFECDAEELIKRINGYEQQAETIELLKHGMKGDYDLDQWLDWAVSKKHMMETIERLRAAIKYSSDYLDENALNIIGSGSKAHRELKDALNKLEAGEL